MGFCFFNNVAVAAQHALDRSALSRVMVFDWDVHHGNGTNDIFHASRRRPVRRASTSRRCIRGPGRRPTPGAARGVGYTVNLPVPGGSGDEVWCSMAEHVVAPLARAFAPELVLVSAGFDAHGDDPLATCRVTDGGFAAMAGQRAAAARLGVPVGLVLEGGYDVDALSRSLCDLEVLGADGRRPPDASLRAPARRAAARAARPRWPAFAGDWRPVAARRRATVARVASSGLAPLRVVGAAGGAGSASPGGARRRRRRRRRGVVGVVGGVVGVASAVAGGVVDRRGRRRRGGGRSAGGGRGARRRRLGILGQVDERDRERGEGERDDDAAAMSGTLQRGRRRDRSAPRRPHSRHQSWSAGRGAAARAVHRPPGGGAGAGGVGGVALTRRRPAAAAAGSASSAGVTVTGDGVAHDRAAQRRAAAGAEVRVGVVQRLAARARGDAGLAQLGDVAAVAQRALERAQLAVDGRQPLELLRRRGRRSRPKRCRSKIRPPRSRNASSRSAAGTAAAAGSARARGTAAPRRREPPRRPPRRPRLSPDGCGGAASGSPAAAARRSALDRSGRGTLGCLGRLAGASGAARCSRRRRDHGLARRGVLAGSGGCCRPVGLLAARQRRLRGVGDGGRPASLRRGRGRHGERVAGRRRASGSGRRRGERVAGGELRALLLRGASSLPSDRRGMRGIGSSLVAAPEPRTSVTLRVDPSRARRTIGLHIPHPWILRCRTACSAWPTPPPSPPSRRCAASAARAPSSTSRSSCCSRSSSPPSSSSAPARTSTSARRSSQAQGARSTASASAAKEVRPRRGQARGPGRRCHHLSAARCRRAPVRQPDPRERPVAVFDSGVGGLTVLHELLVQLPARGLPLPRRHRAVPVRRAQRRGARALHARDRRGAARPPGQAARRRVQHRDGGRAARAAAADDGDDARRRRHRRRPARGGAGGDATSTGRIGLLATPATVRSGAYERAVHDVDPHVELVSVPCPDLAPIIQGGFPFDERVVETVRGYCEPLREAGVDTVILGCTHYPLVRPMLQRFLGRGVQIVTSGEALARQVEHALVVARPVEPAHDRGRLPLPVHGRRRDVPRARHPLPAAAARRRSTASNPARRSPLDPHRRPRARRSCARRRSSPASCRRRPAARSSPRARRA